MIYEKSIKKIKEIIEGMAGKYRIYNIFRDFIVLSACSISNSVDKQQYDSREKMYMETIGKYTKKEADKFANMLGLMTLAYESRMGDFIGELYMSMEFGNRDAGQFFTPYNISRMMSKLVKADSENEVITLNEPACGSGGMIVAYAEEMKSRGRNYQTDLRVICNDVDYDVVKMCYVQLSLLGIDAIVMQGDTMTQKMNEVWFTPMHFINLAREKERESVKKMLESIKEIEVSKDKERLVETAPVGQLDIFDYLGV